MTTNTPVRQHDIGSVVMASDVYTGMIVERDRLKTINAELLAALETVFFALGKSGANADTKHVLRAEWLIARAAIAKAKGE